MEIKAPLNDQEVLARLVDLIKDVEDMSERCNSVASSTALKAVAVMLSGVAKALLKFAAEGKSTPTVTSGNVEALWGQHLPPAEPKGGE